MDAVLGTQAMFTHIPETTSTDRHIGGAFEEERVTEHRTDAGMHEYIKSFDDQIIPWNDFHVFLGPPCWHIIKLRHSNQIACSQFIQCFVKKPEIQSLG